MMTVNDQQLTLSPEGVFLRRGGATYHTVTPITLYTLDHQGFHRVGQKGYETVAEQAGRVVCAATVLSAGGTAFAVKDTWEALSNRFQFSREVTVQSSQGKDIIGFATELVLRADGPVTLHDCDVFIPGVWYGQNEGVVAGAFGSTLDDRDYLLRQTRAALPYVQLQERGAGEYLSLCAVAPSPANGISEVSSQTLVDASLQYASIGLDAAGHPGVRICFPGSEGETCYLDGLVSTRTTARRYHPVAAPVSHRYAAALHAGHADDARQALRDEWRFWFDVFAPKVHPADLDCVERIGTALLDTYCQAYNGAMGLPFWATVPEGTVCDLSFQMGFVGQQTMCAYHLLRGARREGNARMLAKAKAILDFWVTRSREGSVLPRVWYDVYPPRFKPDYPTYTRTLCDGLEGILLSYQYLRREWGEARADWLRFVTETCDWLVAHQHADGSLDRAYHPDGTPAHTGKFNTSNAIRLWVQLYWETGDPAYRAAALRAGEYCYGQMYLPLRYIGGTADNDNTIDKEAGMLALYAFMALYDLTGEEKWLAAAKGAADFTETWTYAWTFAVRPAKGNAVFDKVDITGLSLIATGHSHADVMMGYCAFDFYRLYLFTGDVHYLTFARFLLHNTRQTVDWSGRLGHVYPGLVEESGELARQYHNGLGRWLPWCTIASVETLTRLREWFGSPDIDQLELNHAAMMERNHPQGSSFLR
ncbi:MAG: hypothetical protein PHY12_03770 [Eubacteriales bacterium]|nr:hypothetical protein [Eubacteriales bacterium]